MSFIVIEQGLLDLGLDTRVIGRGGGGSSLGKLRGPALALARNTKRHPGRHP